MSAPMMLVMNTTELKDPGVRADVGVYELDARRPGGEHYRRRAEGAQFQGQVRISTRIDDERVLEPTQAVQHHEDWRQP